MKKCKLYIRSSDDGKECGITGLDIEEIKECPLDIDKRCSRCPTCEGTGMIERPIQGENKYGAFAYTKCPDCDLLKGEKE